MASFVAVVVGFFCLFFFLGGGGEGLLCSFKKKGCFCFVFFLSPFLMENL